MKVKNEIMKPTKIYSKEILKLTQKNNSRPTMIVSEIQTHGRGTMGKKWISKKK